MSYPPYNTPGQGGQPGSNPYPGYGQGGPYQQGAPQSGFGAPPGGQPSYPPQGQFAQPGFAPAKKRGPALWIVVGVLGLAIVVGIVGFFAGWFGGGDFVGDKRPPLGSSFGDWEKAEEDSGFSFGELYTKGDETVVIVEVDQEAVDEANGEFSFDPGDIDIDRGEVREPRKIGPGQFCAPEAVYSVCWARWKDGGYIFSGENENQVESAMRDFVRAAG